MWPETLAALKDAIAERPQPKTAEAEGLLFVTSRGRPWLANGIANPVCIAARDLMKAVKVHRPGIGFYALRHVHRTIADGAKDFPAARLIMGHVDGSIDAVYRETIDDSRLWAVTDYVRNWLFAVKGGAK